MTSKIRALSDEELVQACRSRAETGSTFVDSQLSFERREVQDYYTGKRPYPLREGGSKFVSQDVYLGVEAMKAEIAETFGAGSNIVAFSPQGDNDVDLAKVSTAYCEHIVFRQNEGLLLFQDIVHDGLTNRFGIAKVFWDREETGEDYSFSNATEAEAQQLLSDPEVRLKGKPRVLTGASGIAMISAEFERVTDTSQVRIVAVPPEEFIIGGRTSSLDKAPYLAHRYRASRGELVEMGYKAEVVYELSSDDDWGMEEEKVAREADTLTFLTDDDAPDEAGKMLTVFESYIRIDAEGTGRRQLWRVVHVGSELLERQKVSDHPFVAYVPKPIPHTFYGDNYAARIIQHANTKTTLTRAIIEQAVEATNPRWQVARGGVPNPRELLDNRRGGVVNVRSVSDSVAPLPQTPINPFVLQTIAAVDSDREDVTGISRLSQGMDKKALSHQNSKGLVEQLTNNSQTRTKVMARMFALQFVAPLYLKAYKLAIENESRQAIIEVAGKFVECTPAQWASRRHVAVDMTLGYDERDQRVGELSGLHSMLVSDQGFSRMYDEPQRYELVKEMLEIKGIRNLNRFIADPASLGPVQPDPLKQAEIELAKQKPQIEERQMALRESQVQGEEKRKDAELQDRLATSRNTIMLNRREQMRKEAETKNRIDVALSELDLAIEASINAPPENQKLTSIVSPNS